MSKLKLYNAQGNPLFHVDISQELDRGGEGSILSHPKDTKLVIKLYHDGITPALTPASWTYLNQLGLRFIKPVELFYNQHGTLVGFSMTMLEKSFFRLSQVFTRNQCTKLGIDNTLKLKIATELIAIIQEAHSNELIIGDFNPFNIFLNVGGEIRIIDVDSVETPVQKHSGRLLDDIRDHYYLGTVNRESDYYALAVNVFRMFTYVHPYKGVHKTWKQLEERAVKRISVLSNDADLTIPAFYEPLANKELEMQFKRIFNQGERFLLSIDQVIAAPKRAVPIQTVRTDISIKIIADHVLEVCFNDTLGYVKTTKETGIYDCLFTGNLSLREKISHQDYDHLWLGNKNVIVVKNKKLYQNRRPIENFDIPDNFQAVQINQLVFGVDWENLYQLQPDKIINNNVWWQKNPAWGRGFKFMDSPVQLAGGIARIHYRNGETMNSVKLPVHPKALTIIGNAGVITFLENEKLRHFWCYIEGLHFEMCKETEETFSFAIKQSGGTSFIFVPKDGKIEILRVPDFEVIDSIDFKESTSQSQVFLTHSGLLLLEDQMLYLINRN